MNTHITPTTIRPARAVIPVAGVGTTLRPHTHTQPKPLIPVAGRPILGHIVAFLLDAGITDFVFVVGYMGEKIKAYIEEEHKGRFKATFIHQEPRRGIGHAIWLCREVFHGEPMLIALGDTIIDVDLRQILAESGSVVCVQEVEDPRKFGVAQLGADGFVQSLIEKPTIPKSNLALVGLYKIAETDALFEALNYLITNDIRTRDEFQLTDALMRLVQQGVRIRTQSVTNWFDCGKKDVLIQTNRILLNRMKDLPLPVFPNTVVIPPVYVAAGCDIENSVIGPYVAIAQNAHIRNSVLTDTILGAYSQLESIILNSSIVGNDTRLSGRRHAVNIGDNADIEF